MRVKLVSVVALFVLLLGACSVPKDVVYFQGVDALTPEQVSKMNQAYTSKICPDDLLTITVYLIILTHLFYIAFQMLTFLKTLEYLIIIDQSPMLVIDDHLIAKIRLVGYQ